ncbi:hypothetical protein GCM10020218_080720 [Dactylosporangium vinaceum]
MYLNHHLGHASSAYFGSGAQDAAVLVMDGYGDCVSSEEFETVSIYHGVGTKLRLAARKAGKKDDLHLANSAGILYRIATLSSGFGVMDEGKTMGLAGYGQARYLEDILAHVRFGAEEVAIDNEAIWKSFQDLRRDGFADRADVAASFQARAGAGGALLRTAGPPAHWRRHAVHGGRCRAELCRQPARA